MGNCSPKKFHYGPPPTLIDGVWYIDGPSILPEPLERHYIKRPEYVSIWMRPLPSWIEPLKPSNEFSYSQDLHKITPFTGKLAPLKLF